MVEAETRTGQEVPPDSYVLPYTLASCTVGALLTYASHKPVFFLASIPVGVSCGLVRDRNVRLSLMRQRNDVSSLADSALKSVTLYTLGPAAVALTLGLGFVLALQ